MLKLYNRSLWAIIGNLNWTNELISIQMVPQWSCSMKISLIQFNASADKIENLRRLTDLVEAALQASQADLVVLPEMSACIAPDPNVVHANAEPFDGPYASALAALAARFHINVHCGSFVELRDGRYYNTSLVFNRSGDQIGRYSKIHRFDVTLPNGVELSESSIVERGEEIVVVDIDGIPVGLSICYDLRFAELFLKLVQNGAKIIIVPAAFTFQTGADHWEILLRARAIETQCFVAAAAQTGSFGDGKYMNFGHSMIVDPWGQIIAQCSNGEGHVSGSADLRYLAQVRANLPVQQHRVL